MVNYPNNNYQPDYEYNNIEIKRNKIHVNKGIILLFAGIFAYIGFLVLGVSDTRYKTTDQGNKQAVVANLEDRDAREDYNALKVYYINLVNMLESCDDYEYQMEHSLATYFTLSTKYSDLLTTIDSNMTKIRGLDVDTKYESLQAQLYETYNYIALYSQKMNSALLNDNYDSYAEAMTWKETAENSLENARKNFITFGEDYAKIFDDEDLATSRLYDETTENNAITPTPTPTISTGVYGEESTIATPTPTPITNSNLGAGRLDTTIQNNNSSNEETNTETTKEDDNISIQNPYSNDTTPSTENNDVETTPTPTIEVTPTQAVEEDGSTLGRGRN